VQWQNRLRRSLLDDEKENQRDKKKQLNNDEVW